MILFILPSHLRHGILSLPYTFSICEKYPGFPSTFEKSLRVVPPLLIASLRTFLMEFDKVMRRFFEIFPAPLFGDIPARKRLSEAYILPTPTTILLSIMKVLIFLDFPIDDLDREFSSNS
jgi:hypothetical protein